MPSLRVISNYRVFIPTTHRQLICTQQPGPNIMKSITSIKAMQLAEKGRNVIIHFETETCPCFPSHCETLSNYYASSLSCSVVLSRWEHHPLVLLQKRKKYSSFDPHPPPSFYGRHTIDKKLKKIVFMFDYFQLIIFDLVLGK